MNTLSRNSIQRSFLGCSFIFIALTLTCFAAGGYPAFSQQVSSLSTANGHPFGRLAGATSEAGDTGQALIASATPAWTPFYQFTPHTGLANHSAVYDPTTNTMIVFGGADAGLGIEVTNAVLILTGANNGTGAWSTLIANGTAGSPTARQAHSAVYDSANNRMIVFGGCTGAFGGGPFFCAR